MPAMGRWVCWVCVCLLVVGCKRAADSDPLSKDQVSTDQVSNEDEAGRSESTTATDAESTNRDVADDSVSSSSAGETIDESTTPEPDADRHGDRVAESSIGSTDTPVKPDERLLLFAPQGPLIVDFILSANGESIQHDSDDAYRRAAQFADNDQDGRRPGTS